MSLDRMSAGAATAGVAMLAASVALGVSAWPGVALLVLGAAVAGFQEVLDNSEAQALENRISQLEHRLQTVTAKHDELGADVEALKRRAALNSL